MRIGILLLAWGLIATTSAASPASTSAHEDAGTDTTCTYPAALPQLLDASVNASHLPPLPVATLVLKSSQTPLRNYLWWISKVGNSNDYAITNRTRGPVQVTMDKDGDVYTFKIFSNQSLSSMRVSAIFNDDCRSVIRSVQFFMESRRDMKEEQTPSMIMTASEKEVELNPGLLNINFKMKSEYFYRFYTRLVTYRTETGIDGETREHGNVFYSYFDNDFILPFNVTSHDIVKNGSERTTKAAVRIPSNLKHFSLDHIALMKGSWGDPIYLDYINYIINYHAPGPQTPTHFLHPCYRGFTDTEGDVGGIQYVKVTRGYNVCFYIQVEGSPLPRSTLYRLDGASRVEMESTEPSPPTRTTSMKLYFWRELGRHERIELRLRVEGDAGYEQRIILKPMSRHQVIYLTSNK